MEVVAELTIEASVIANFIVTFVVIETTFSAVDAPPAIDGSLS